MLFSTICAMRIVICLTTLISVFCGLCHSQDVSSVSEEEKRYTVQIYANALHFFKIPSYQGLMEHKGTLDAVVDTYFNYFTTFLLCKIDDHLNLHAWCFRENNRFSVLYDTNWNIAGVRIGLVEEDLQKKMQSKRQNSLKFPINYALNNMYTKTSGWYKSYYYTDILFGEPNFFLAPSSGHDNEWRFKGKIDTIVMKLDGAWTQLPTQECDAELYEFTKQGCWQGQYYFHKMTKDSDCKDLSGAFVFFEDGQLIGVGIMAFGSYEVTAGYRAWFEDLTETQIKRIVPNRPPCFIDWFRKYGISPIHIFLKKPKMTTCTMFGSKATDCSIHHQQYSQGDQGDESYYDGEE